MYFSDSTYVFHNGTFVPAKEATTNLYAQTLHYGTGVFEGIRSYNTSGGIKIFKAVEHYERLLTSAKKMHIDLSYSTDELIEITNELLIKNNLSNSYIRPLVYLGANMSLSPTSEVNCMICAWDWGKYHAAKMFKVRLSSYVRPHPKSCHVDAKVTGHYINSILANTEAKKHGFDEALLLDLNGNVAEGAGANFFFEKNGILYTPPTGNILPGITRASIIDIAKRNNISIIEKHFTIDEARKADSAFFTGTAIEIGGIAQLDDIIFPMEWEQTLGYKLSLLFSEEINK